MSILSFLKKVDTRAVCPACGKSHNESSLSFQQPWCEINEKEGDVLTEDLCVLKKIDAYFIRVILEIPIVGHSGVFTWGVWISQSKENFEFYKEHFTEGNRHSFGWLSNSLPTYEDTLNLKTQVCFRGEGLRPVIEINECDHQLYRDFINGITLERAEELMKIGQTVSKA